MSELILLCRPEEVNEARQCGLKIACAAWQVGAEGRLWRLPAPRVGIDMPAVFDALGRSTAALKAEIRSECARLGTDTLLYFAPTSEKISIEGCRVYCPRSTALSGGELAVLFAAHDAALIEPVMEYFALPSKNGSGEPINSARLKACADAAECSGFSSELGCKYHFTRSGCVLYDDAETIGYKLKLLKGLGVKLIVLPYMSELVREFLRKYP